MMSRCGWGAARNRLDTTGWGNLEVTVKRSCASAGLFLLLVACGGSRSGISVTVLLHRTGMGSSTQMAPSLFRRIGPVPVTVDVRNESGGDAALEEIVAVVMNAAGRTQARITLTKQQVLERGASTRYRGVLSGEWSRDSVVGVWTRVTVGGNRPGLSGSCTPLHMSRDSRKLQRACGHLRDENGPAFPAN